jgi:CPA2 family monovalent cation:H+ antiporter-2
MWMDKRYSNGPLLAIEITRIVVATLFMSFWVFQLFETRVAIFIAVPVVLGAFYIFAKRIKAVYQRIEGRFLDNLNARETAAYNSVAANVSRRNDEITSRLAPWDAHIVQLEVTPGVEFIGRTLAELKWRERFGVNLVYIKRGEKIIQTPDRDSILLPFDQVGLIGTDAQIQSLKVLFDYVEPKNPGVETDVQDIVLQKIIVDEHNLLQGKDIRSSGIRDLARGLVIGIERNNQRILNPESNTVFEWDDVVWIVGDRRRIQAIIDKEAMPS